MSLKNNMSNCVAKYPRSVAVVINKLRRGLAIFVGRGWRSVKGFTLTEVMIGMMILTVAIVSASNLLTGIISSNQNNLTTLQAYYLSQEGLEIVRNIRDTNWLHNRDWLGKGSNEVWGGSFAVTVDDAESNTYAVEVVDAGGTKVDNEDSSDEAPTIANVGNNSPWKIDSNGIGKIYRHGADAGSNDRPFLDSINGGAQDTGFKRTIIIKKYDCGYLPNGLCSTAGPNPYVLVQSKVEWNIGARQRELTLSEVLANWKGGAL